MVKGPANWSGNFRKKLKLREIARVSQKTIVEELLKKYSNGMPFSTQTSPGLELWIEDNEYIETSQLILKCQEFITMIEVAYQQDHIILNFIWRYRVL